MVQTIELTAFDCASLDLDIGMTIKGGYVRWEMARLSRDGRKVRLMRLVQHEGMKLEQRNCWVDLDAILVVELNRPTRERLEDEGMLSKSNEEE